VKHIVILRPAPDTPIEMLLDLQLTEEQAVWQLYVGDIIRAMYWSGDPANLATVKVVAELETADTAAAEAVVSGLPMIKAGVMIPEIIPLRPWKPLEILFARQD
jgi:hypothetical protein